MKNQIDLRGDHAAVIIAPTEKRPRLEALVDIADLPAIDIAGTWGVMFAKNTGNYYAMVSGKAERLPDGRYRRVPKTCLLMHRRVMGDKCANKRRVDHRNHDTMDNRRANLRAATDTLNKLNGKDPDRGIKEIRGRWRVSITYRGKLYKLGYFDTKEQAKLIREGAVMLAEKLEAIRMDCLAEASNA